MSDKAQPWDAFLLAGNHAQRWALLPTELRLSLDHFLQSLFDLYDEAYADPLSTPPQASEKVQAEPSHHGMRSEARPEFARYLERRLPRRLDTMRTEVRQMLAFDDVVPDARRGPRFRRRAG